WITRERPEKNRRARTLHSHDHDHFFFHRRGSDRGRSEMSCKALAAVWQGRVVIWHRGQPLSVRGGEGELSGAAAVPGAPTNQFRPRGLRFLARTAAPVGALITRR